MNYSIVCADKLSIDSISLKQQKYIYLMLKFVKSEKKCIVRYLQSEANLFMFFLTAYDDYTLRNR